MGQTLKSNRNSITEDFQLVKNNCINVSNAEDLKQGNYCTVSLERKIKGMHSVVSAKGPKCSHLFWFCSEAKDHSTE